MSGTWAPSPSAEVAWVELDGEVVVFHGGEHRVHLLNDSGALLWQLFDGTATVEDLASDVAAVFGLPQDVALDQVQSFAEHMASLGLVDVAAEEPGHHG